MKHTLENLFPVPGRPGECAQSIQRVRKKLLSTQARPDPSSTSLVSHRSSKVLEKKVDRVLGNRFTIGFTKEILSKSDDDLWATFDDFWLDY